MAVFSTMSNHACAFPKSLIVDLILAAGAFISIVSVAFWRVGPCAHDTDTDRAHNAASSEAARREYRLVLMLIVLIMLIVMNMI